jgi:hypothetical protein
MNLDVDGRLFLAPDLMLLIGCGAASIRVASVPTTPLAMVFRAGMSPRAMNDHSRACSRDK